MLEEFFFLQKLKVPPQNESFEYYFENLARSKQFADISPKYQRYLQFHEECIKEGTTTKAKLRHYSEEYAAL